MGGADIICFQELFNLPWFPKSKDESAFELAEEPKGYSVDRIKEKSRSSGSVILLPIFEKHLKHYYNSCVIIDKGKVNGIYRKIHVPDIPLWEEKFYFSTGNKGFPVFETSHGRIAVQISWDNLYPEGAGYLH